MSEWHIAQINVARALYPIDDPRIADFVNALDEINALADASTGFVWRLQSAQGNATDIRVDTAPDLLINVSVWQSVEALFDFVYKTAHRSVMVRRREWFARPDGPHQALWWLAAGQTPSLEESLRRLDMLRAQGSTLEAFDFKRRFPPPGRIGGPDDMRPDPYCVGWS